MKLPWWDVAAGRLQVAIRSEEAGKGERYRPDEVGRAVIHTRDDLSLVVSYLSSLNRQFATLQIMLGVLIAVAVVIAFRV